MPSLLPLFFAACVTPLDDSASKGANAPDTLEISAELAEVQTVVQVAWAGVEDAQVIVEYGADTDYGHVARPRLEEPGEVLLIGNVPGEPVHFRLVGTGGEGGDWVSEDQTIQAGTLTGDLPRFNGLQTPAPTWDSFVLVPVFDQETGTSQVVLLDRDARVVWAREVAASVLRVRVGSDGAVLYLGEGDRSGAPNGIYRLAWEGGDAKMVVYAERAHHDFLEQPDGSFVVLESQVQSWEGEDVIGDRLVEHATDGGSRVLWDSWTELTPSFDEEGGMVTPLGRDWTHVNGVDYDPTTDRYLLSSYWLEALFAVDASDGAIAWQMGGADADINVVGDSGFGPQHSPLFVDGGVLMFDNHRSNDSGDPVGASRAVRYDVDVASGRASLAWEFTPEASVAQLVQGDVNPLADGGFVVCSGEAGRVVAVGADDRIQYSVEAQAGTVLGRGVVFNADMVEE